MKTGSTAPLGGFSPQFPGSFGTLAVFCIGIALVITHVQETTANSRVLTAERFLLTDSLGTERASLSLNAFNLPRLGLNGEDGQSWIVLELLPPQSARLQVSAGKQASVQLFMFEDGESLLSFFDPEGRTRLGLGIDQGEPFISILDTDGRTIRTLP